MTNNTSPASSSSAGPYLYYRPRPGLLARLRTAWHADYQAGYAAGYRDGYDDGYDHADEEDPRWN